MFKSGNRIALRCEAISFSHTVAAWAFLYPLATSPLQYWGWGDVDDGVLHEFVHSYVYDYYLRS